MGFLDGVEVFYNMVVEVGVEGWECLLDGVQDIERELAVVGAHFDEVVGLR